MKKVLACTLLVATTFMTCGVNKAEAFEDPYEEFYCHSEERYVCCVGPMNTSGSKVPHLMYSSIDGNVYCGIVTVYGPHDVYCSSCNGYVDSLGLTHARYHDICPPEENVCQDYFKEDDSENEN